MAIDPKSRLRGSFADVLQRQAAELAQLASDAVRDPDIRDALLFELERIHGTEPAVTTLICMSPPACWLVVLLYHVATKRLRTGGRTRASLPAFPATLAGPLSHVALPD